MSRVTEDLILWILASPLIILRALRRGTRHLRYVRVASTPSISCEWCAETISLMEAWRCPCGFTYYGHVLQVCPVCGGSAAYVRCHACGAATLLPEA